MSEVIQSQTKSQPFRDFMRRLVKEQPIGAVSLVFMVLFCLVAIFADDALAVSLPGHDDDRPLERPLEQLPTGYRPHRPRCADPTAVRCASLDWRGLCRHHLERAGLRAHWRSGRIFGRKIRPDGAALCRCLDVLSRSAPAADGHDHRGTGRFADHRGARGDLRHCQLAGDPQRRDRDQGERLL